MATINQIPMSIMGNITADLEPKHTAGGKTVVSFRVAQSSATERNGRWEDGETTYIRCVAYGAMADHMVASGMRKGTRIVATGRYVQRDYQTEAGERRSVYELNVDDLGASVRYATVQQQPQAGMTEGGDRRAQNTDWPAGPGAVFANPTEPMI